MSEIGFWDRVKHGADRLGIANGVVRNWKHRGRVSREQQIPLFQVLAGTAHEVSLEEISKKHPADVRSGQHNVQ
jgi:hypothetical protein